jgi:hypothetical protein
MNDANELLRLCDMLIGDFAQAPHLEDDPAILKVARALRARLSSPSAADLPQGHGKPCYYCGELCNSLASFGGLSPIPLCHSDDPGKVKWHHTKCVSARLIENQPPSAPPEAGKVQEPIQRLLRLLRSMQSIGYFTNDEWQTRIAEAEEALRHPSPVAQGAGVEWISVKERLPELVHVENKETIFLGRILTIERMSDRVIVSLDDQDFSADMLVHIGGHEFPIWRRHGDRVKFWKPGPPKPTAREGGGL